MLKINRNESSLAALDTPTLADVSITERYDLQEYISNSPDAFFQEIGQQLFWSLCYSSFDKAEAEAHPARARKTTKNEARLSCVPFYCPFIVREHGFLQSRTGPVIDDKIRKLSDYAIT